MSSVTVGSSIPRSIEVAIARSVGRNIHLSCFGQLFRHFRIGISCPSGQMNLVAGINLLLPVILQIHTYKVPAVLGPHAVFEPYGT